VTGITDYLAQHTVSRVKLYTDQGLQLSAPDKNISGFPEMFDLSLSAGAFKLLSTLRELRARNPEPRNF